MIYCRQQAQFYDKDKLTAKRFSCNDRLTAKRSGIDFLGGDHWLLILADGGIIAEWLIDGATAAEIDAIVAAINAIPNRIAKQKEASENELTNARTGDQ